ncbi:hypothetical protein [Stappia sp. ES.058]|uniref:hypothetical protein n=1 Tax=Stappia sp. ES.058 TaxID=1881061 RepID=UPI00087B68C0|nr:hypothetical protein [Stappia sp. ES.058]SDU32573.1 hypothetical protein SAMN05428979_2988 [Stappia sp. ES.058]
MITLGKRTPGLGAPPIVAAVFLAAALAASGMLRAEPTLSDETAAGAQSAKTESTTREKGDLRIDLSDVEGRHTRCVSRNQKTTCTGWPVFAGPLAYRGD